MSAGTNNGYSPEVRAADQRAMDVNRVTLTYLRHALVDMTEGRIPEGLEKIGDAIDALYVECEALVHRGAIPGPLGVLDAERL